MSFSENLDFPVIVNPVRWEAAQDGFVPKGAVCGGKTFDGELIYIGRTKLLENQDELTPGVLIPSQGCLKVSYGTGVRRSQKYEVLVTSDPHFVQWVSCEYGQVPANAVIGGIDSSYLEPLYIGRTMGHMSLGRTWRGQRFPELRSSDSEVPRSSRDSALQSKQGCSSPGTLLNGHAKPEDAARMNVCYPGKVHGSHKCLYIPYDDKEYLFRNYQVLTLTSSPASLSILCKCSIRYHITKSMQEYGGVATPTKTQRNSSSLMVPGRDEFSDFEKSIDLLPLPPKLRQFCK